jgi:hypothetical protein
MTAGLAMQVLEAANGERPKRSKSREVRKGKHEYG